MQVVWKNKGNPEAARAAVMYKEDKKIACVISTFGYATGPEAGSPEYHTEEIAATTVLEELERAVDVLVEIDNADVSDSIRRSRRP